MSQPAHIRQCRIAWEEREVDIEYTWVGHADSAANAGSTAPAPLMVFLHEGLGSVAMWRDFPHRLCERLGWRGLVYSRPGYGQSTPRAAHDHWQPDFMHRQAQDVLPALLAALGIDTLRQPPWLFGHSDGGSIALLHASAYPEQVAGLVVLAPHILVEEVSVTSIEQARRAYLDTDPKLNLKTRLGRYHADPDSAFWGWNDVWLSDAFRTWRITDAELARIRCPVLAVQGLDDEYGTLAQIRGIQALAPHTRLLELPACGHSPHKDQPEALMAAVEQFVAEQG